MHLQKVIRAGNNLSQDVTDDVSRPRRRIGACPKVLAPRRVLDLVGEIPVLRLHSRGRRRADRRFIVRSYSVLFDLRSLPCQHVFDVRVRSSGARIYRP